MDEKMKDIIDNGGRRLGIDRRQLDLPFSGDDRRSGNERRTKEDRRGEWYRLEEEKERRESYYLK